MKSINVKTHETVKFMDKGLLNTFHLIEIALNQQPPTGFMYNDIKNRNRIDAAVKKSKNKKTIELEDADFEILKNLAKVTGWPSRDPFVEEFLDGLGIK